MDGNCKETVQDVFFSYKLCFCWILFMDGTTYGFNIMSSSGKWQHFTVPIPFGIFCVLHIPLLQFTRK
ncbi:hypothetical protein RchiOBHm_Chr2g0130941 [Rosa chinensis]|uniref:Uncharacterized protein n=1 Tax=Rosa chinensis TaxID=74649 RepID=A0A2P6RUZ4_ROSCH|nr:hypothetical protein RchiOBHm_Chr2g0130941 [Rosa chinensis]